MEIPLYQLKEIEDALRMVINYRRQLGHDETCMDRCVKKSYKFVTDILKERKYETNRKVQS